jgi:hypothetical protein
MDLEIQTYPVEDANAAQTSLLEERRWRRAVVERLPIGQLITCLRRGLAQALRFRAMR